MPKRQFLTPDQKIAIVREQLLDKVLVSDLCDKAAEIMKSVVVATDVVIIPIQPSPFDVVAAGENWVSS